MWRKIIIVLFILITPIVIELVLRSFRDDVAIDQGAKNICRVGTIIDREKGVPIHSNGTDCMVNHGKHFSNDDHYYYGERWQCVEFVKRYYHDRFDHHMPDVWGEAKSYFDATVQQGQLNPQRGLVQYRNGGNERPEPEDLLVYDYGECGHAAIISKVTENSVEIVQQNVPGQPRITLPLLKTENGWFLGGGNKPVGWLRMPTQKVSKN